MVNVCNVLYKGDRGLITFADNKVVFQHRNTEKTVKEGLGVIKAGTLEDKGSYAFGVFENVKTERPQGYNTLDFFKSKGVPQKVYVGKYGENILYKEVYAGKQTIIAYNIEGDCLFYENDKKRGVDYCGLNMYYIRIDELVEWEEVTDWLEEGVLLDLMSKTADLCIKEPKVYQALKGLSRNRVYYLDNGVLIAEGKFESLAIWGDADEIQMAWLGRQVKLPVKREVAKEELQE